VSLVTVTAFGAITPGALVTGTFASLGVPAANTIEGHNAMMAKNLRMKIPPESKQTYYWTPPMQVNLLPGYRSVYDEMLVFAQVRDPNE
jgi:hypothetical protein